MNSLTNNKYFRTTGNFSRSWESEVKCGRAPLHRRLHVLSDLKVGQFPWLYTFTHSISPLSYLLQMLFFFKPGNCVIPCPPHSPNPVRILSSLGLECNPSCSLLLSPDPALHPDEALNEYLLNHSQNNCT